MKEYDLINRLNFLLETLYYDACATDNVILFDYDPAYPRIFLGEFDTLLKALENATKAYVYATSKNKIKIGVRLTNYNTSNVFFRVTIGPAEEISEPNSTYIKKLKDIVSKDERCTLVIKENEMYLDIELKLSSYSTVSNIVLKNDIIRSYHALITYDDKDGFDILYRQLRYIGLEVKTKDSYENLKSHLNDAIYSPSIIFIQKSYIENSEIFEEILTTQKQKKFQIVAICDKDDRFDKKVKEKITILRQPYTYDILAAVLNLSYLNRLQNKL